MAHSTTGENYTGPIATDPLERSQWSAGWGGCFVYCDFLFLPDETCVLHCAYDFGKCKQSPQYSNTCADYAYLRVPDDEAATEAAKLIVEVVDWFREVVGRLPIPLQNLRNFAHAVRESEG